MTGFLNTPTATLVNNNKYLFNFNPKEVKVEKFIDDVFKTILGENKFSDLRNKQQIIDSHKDENGDLMSEVLEEVLELKDKIKFTYNGFDISKTPIPIEIISRSSMLENKLLDLLAVGYFVNQLYSIYNITNEQFEAVSKKTIKDRSPEEICKYQEISDLLRKILQVKKCLNKGLVEENKKTIKTIKKIKSREAQEIYKLLKHLLPPKNNYKISFYKLLSPYQQVPSGSELFSPNSLSLSL
ncbi:MAG: hypothetical protein REH83_01890 [Rickettsiella sp.]|nr:hypothetical protein [Rickettsiella sp.]